jgi:hypothetical protein
VVVRRIVEVHPFYGWGWTDTEQTAWDYIPEAFHAEVTPKTEVWFGKEVRTLQGVVKEPSHEMNGFSVFLSERHHPWDGHVNVALKSETGRKLVGFGSIGLDGFDG